MIIETFREELRNGATLEETLIKHELTLKEALELCGGTRKTATPKLPLPKFKKPKKPEEVEVKPTWIKKRNGNYQTVVYKNSRHYYFGTYETEEEAKQIIKEMFKVNLNISKLGEVKAKLGIETTSNKKKYYSYNKTHKRYDISRRFNKNRVFYCSCKTEEEAQQIVAKLKQHRWNKGHVNQIREELGLI